MLRRILITIMLALVIVSVSHADTRILFMIEQGRSEEILKQDAELIASVVRDSKYGDIIECLTIEGKTIFSLHGTEKNRLRLRKEQNIALERLRQWFLQETRSQRKQKKLDIAAAVNRATQRFNSGSSKKRYILVLMTSGLHHVHNVDFTGGRYPADTWVSHPASPFNAIKANMTGKPVEVIFVTKSDDFLNQLHSQRIERFYALLLNAKKAKLIGFSDDHQVASDLIKNGTKFPVPVPDPEPGDGKLSIYKINCEETSQLQHKTPAVKVKAVPEKLSGSVLQLAVDKGTANLWVSLRDPQGNPISHNVNGSQIHLQETINGKRRDIPPSSVKVHSKSNKPLAVVLLRDISGSQQAPQLAESKRGISAFIGRMRDRDVAAIVTFSSDVEVVKNFTNNKSELLSALVPPKGQSDTAFYDAIIKAAKMLSNKSDSWTAIIGFTDGMDSASDKTDADAIAASKKSDTPVFLIGCGDVDQFTLTRIATATGGLFFPVSDTSALQKIYSHISDILNNSMVVSYPTKAKKNDSVKVDALLDFDRSGKRFEGVFSSEAVVR
jgi:uncharacterized protein YegL